MLSRRTDGAAILSVTIGLTSAERGLLSLSLSLSLSPPPFSSLLSSCSVLSIVLLSLSLSFFLCFCSSDIGANGLLIAKERERERIEGGKQKVAQKGPRRRRRIPALPLSLLHCGLLLLRSVWRSAEFCFTSLITKSLLGIIRVLEGLSISSTPS